MERIHYIYALVDPRTDEVRYVGKTVDLHRRIARHCRLESSSLYRINWLRTLLAEGLRPTVWVLECASEENWRHAERWWIAHLRSEGARLTNLTAGGDGTSGYRYPEASREKLRRPKSPSHRANISTGMKAYLSAHPEVIEARSEAVRRAHTGRVHTQEHRANVASAVAQNWTKPEFRKKVLLGMQKPDVRLRLVAGGESHAGKPKSPEQRAKIAEAARKRAKSPCVLCGREMTSNSMVLHLRAHARRGETALQLQPSDAAVTGTAY